MEDKDKSIGWLREGERNETGRGWSMDQDLRTEMQKIDGGSEIEVIDKGRDR